MELDAVQLESLSDSLVDADDKYLHDLIAMRKKHHLSQDAVAERMGVSQPTVAAFERYDANPTLATIRRYALAVGASVDHVVDDRCCKTDSATFAAVVSGASDWYTVPALTFGWGAWAAGDMKISHG